MMNVYVVDERRISWKPTTFHNEREAIIRNGELTELGELPIDLIDGDIDGLVEFLQAIKKAKEETK